MHKEPIRIFVSAGELSGDLHAAKLVTALKNRENNIEIKAMGGPAMESAGADVVLDCRRYASLHGFNIPVLVWKSVGTLFKIVKILRAWKPHQVILVDYPDFNLFLAKVCGWFGIPCFYLIPPTIWAWREERLEQIKKRVQGCALIYPFEEEYYHSRGYQQAYYVGHPLVDDQHAGRFKKDYRKSLATKLGLSADKPVLAVLPGSRLSEVRRMLPIITESLLELKRQQPDLQAVISLASTVQDNQIARLKKPLDQLDWVKFSRESAVDIMKSSDIGLIKSGTCTLEAALIGIPFICFYKVSALASFIIKRRVKLKEYAPVNLVLSGSVPELMQENANVKNISEQLLVLLSSQDRFQDAKRKLTDVVEKLSSVSNLPIKSDYQKVAEQTFSERTAALILSKIRFAPYGLYNRILTYLRPYKGKFVLALVCMTIFGASDGAVPFLIKYILDGVFTAKDPSLLWILAVSLIGFSIIRAVCDFGQQYLTAKIGHLIVHDIRNELHNKIMQLSSRFFIRHSSGDLLARQTSDVIQIGNLLTTSLTALIRDTIRCITLLIAAVSLDPVLAAVALIGLPIGFLPVYKFSRRLRRLGRTSQAAVGSITTKLQESINGLKVIQQFDQTQFEQGRFEQANSDLNRSLVKSERIRALTGPINEVIAAVAICAVMSYGAFSVMQNVRTSGDFIAFLIAIFLMYDPFKKLSRMSGNVQQGFASAERVFEILDVVPEISSPSNPVTLPSSNDIKFKDVAVRYEADKSPALRDINLTIYEGQKVALVGPSGSGKSTLVDLIPRFIDPDMGEISIGGVNLKSAALQKVRAKSAMVSQHTFLFNDTIYKNIAYGRKDATEAEIIACAQAANAYEFIMRLPQKFATVIGESGLSLSGGERQRIAIARALLKDAPILILDEATASLDNQSEHEVQQALEFLLKGRTSLIVAHRLSTIKNVDLVVVIEAGTIVEIGTQAELLKNPGTFAKLHALQFNA